MVFTENLYHRNKALASYPFDFLLKCFFLFFRSSTHSKF